MTPDKINAVFEFGGALFTLLHIRRILQDREVRGVHIGPVIFYVAWGLWCLLYYPWLNQWWSFAGDVALTGTNVVWLYLLFKFRPKKEKPWQNTW